MPTSVIALIPARAGSARVPGKNVRELAGHPLLAYSIAAARESGLFEAIVVSTDSERRLARDSSTASRTAPEGAVGSNSWRAARRNQ